jgi:hypothetical protein
MAFVDPITVPNLIDLANIGGVLTPGTIAPKGITGFSRKRDWDVKKSKGSSGATITDTGAPPAEGSIKLLLWRREFDPPDFVDDFVNWETLRAVLDTAKGDKSKVQALTIIHPMINQQGITDVVVKDYTPLQDEGGGLWSVTITLLEWRAPKPAGGTPKAGGWYAGPGADGKPPKNAQDQQDKELQELLDKARE